MANEGPLDIRLYQEDAGLFFAWKSGALFVFESEKREAALLEGLRIASGDKRGPTWSGLNIPPGLWPERSRGIKQLLGADNNGRTT